MDEFPPPEKMILINHLYPLLGTIDNKTCSKCGRVFKEFGVRWVSRSRNASIPLVLCVECAPAEWKRIAVAGKIGYIKRGSPPATTEYCPRCGGEVKYILEPDAGRNIYGVERCVACSYEVVSRWELDYETSN